MAKVEGANELINKFKNLSSSLDWTQPLQEACLMVENSAKQNIVNNGSDRHGEYGLLGSITHEIDGNVGYVGTNKFYAPYVEYGTGAYAANGDGRPGYWVFVAGDDGQHKATIRKEYTLEEAKQVMAILRSKGLEAYYTNGQHPKPFLNPALDENKGAIGEIFYNFIVEELS